MRFALFCACKWLFYCVEMLKMSVLYCKTRQWDPRLVALFLLTAEVFVERFLSFHFSWRTSKEIGKKINKIHFPLNPAPQHSLKREMDGGNCRRRVFSLFS